MIGFQVLSTKWTNAIGFNFRQNFLVQPVGPIIGAVRVYELLVVGHVLVIWELVPASPDEDHSRLI